MKIVEVERRHLRSLHRWEMDEELQQKTGVDVPRTYQQFLQSYDLYFKGEKPDLLLKAIECDGEIIGKVELYRAKDRDYIGIVLGDRQRSGIGTKALQQFIEIIHYRYGISNIFAEVFEDNDQSLRFFQKNGFEFIGEEVVEWFRGKPRTLITLKKNVEEAFR
ncbi:MULTISPECIES: GNAT family protein [unclassified Halobacillus]|nr:MULTISPECIES: GNAT family protein [unclassified Halobacillus]